MTWVVGLLPSASPSKILWRAPFGGFDNNPPVLSGGMGRFALHGCALRMPDQEQQLAANRVREQASVRRSLRGASRPGFHPVPVRRRIANHPDPESRAFTSDRIAMSEYGRGIIFGSLSTLCSRVGFFASEPKGHSHTFRMVSDSIV